MEKMNSGLKNLQHVLKKVGKPTKVFKMRGGIKALILPHGGRVLGLFATNSEENFYWTNNALNSLKDARNFYTGNQWHNSGGDRTWLAPEADLFFPNFPKREPYVQQRSLDPGHYTVVTAKDRMQLANRLTIFFSRSGQRGNLKILKTILAAKNPLRYEHGLNLETIEYAGYTQQTSLELTAARHQTCDPVGIWNLVQVPHGGHLLIPTFARTQPRHLFSTINSIPQQDLNVTDHLVHYRMRQEGEHKIAIRAVSTCGRIGYLYQNKNLWNLIIRNFMVNPSGEYVDVPWSNTNDFGYAVQACNVKSSLGAFSELEYHVPAIGHGTDCSRCVDTTQIWAFRGTKRQIGLVTKTLLTEDYPPLT